MQTNLYSAKNRENESEVREFRGGLTVLVISRVFRLALINFGFLRLRLPKFGSAATTAWSLGRA